VTTTYTVLDAHGDVQDRGLDLEAAAHMVLTYDGYEYEVRPDDDGWLSLWISQARRNSYGGPRGLTKSVISGNTEDEIWRQVIANAWWWQGCDVLADADYDILSKIDD